MRHRALINGEKYILIHECASSDTRTCRIALDCGLARLDAVGRLYAVWSWAFDQAEDGRLPGTLSTIDEIAELEGFGAAMEAVGWLEIHDDGMLTVVPDSDVVRLP